MTQPEFRMTIGTPIKVIWIDSTSDENYWRTLEDIDENMKEPPMIPETMGYFAGANDTILYVAQTLFKVDGEIHKVGGIFKIPIGCIIRVE